MAQATRRQRRPVLTDKMIAALPRKPAAYLHPDPELPKHGIRIRPTGPGAYTVIARDPYGKQKWVKIGSTAEMAIAAARDEARKVIRRIEQGLEPFEPPPPRRDSVADVAEQWLKRHVEKNRQRTAGKKRRRVEKYILPYLGQHDFTAVTRKQIAELLDTIEDKHGAHTADATLVLLRAMATWWQSRDGTYRPPFVKGMRRVPKAARKRKRALNDAELKAVWSAAGNAGPYGALIKLLLMCAQRRDKVITMRWSDIAPDGTWTIRTEQGEKGNAGSVLLPQAALDIIREQPRFVDNDFVFAGSHSKRWRGSFSRSKQAFDQACGVQDWRLHDLRRTARSLMSRAGVLSEIAERVLGHAVGEIEATYDVHSYAAEKANALRKLAALIELIVNPPDGANVVPMVKAAVP